MDTLSKRQRSERMGRIKAKDTKPEMTVRRLVHGLGYRYRLHRRDLPGNLDLVFTSRRKVIFVHGCFWHRHPDKDCKLARLPKTRLDFWLPKLEANRERDIKKQKQLRDLGWRFMIIWECQLNNLDDLLINIKGFLEAK